MLGRLWNRLPAIVRGILVAELVVSIGTIPPSVAVILNMRTSPSIPWMVVVTAGWLWFFSWYLSGHGWPRSTAEARQRDLRAPSLSKRAWAWALIAGALGITGTIAIAFATARLAHLPREAFAAPIEVLEVPNADSCLRNRLYQRDRGRRGRSRVSGFLDLADPEATWLDNRDSD